ncbi:MAG: RNA-binding transcriptional accessory protein [Oscillospiraceae bacterium]|nr:RNA-binding transcriptional accessory protein [Oscillospiraceae bacterium]
MSYAEIIAKEFSVKEEYVNNIIALLDEGNTIPFIARYRKELHGTMDDQLIRAISEKLEYLRNLDARREEVRALIDGQGNLTDEISTLLTNATTLAEIDDIYRPFRPKRKTRASVARARGLEPLADAIVAAQETGEDPEALAADFVDAEKEVPDIAAALAGAMDIIAEDVSDDAEVRKRVRNLTKMYGIVSSTAAKDAEDSVYSMYYDFKQPVEKIAGHRVLALNRGEKEEFLKVSVDMEDTRPLTSIRSLFVKGTNAAASLVSAACEDAYSRLIFPSIEREIRSELTDAASEDAIKLFGTNLRQLLMAPPVKGKIAIGLDPGYRTGCKLAVVDETGKVLDTDVLYITHGEDREKKSAQVLKEKISRHKADVIAIGNGTASKETELFVAKILRDIPDKVSYMVVSEAGASVYSASKAAADEMPEFDLTLRSAVSIARRLQDPLAELVKIEPKAIGVGQYQHDMPQKRLEAALSGVVEDCVNSVGADLNTASSALLGHISGLSSAVCKNIVAYREENGSFKSRAELKKVPKLGAKAYEQCAGFLRVADSRNPLDNTGVHPESYKAAESLLSEFGMDIKNLSENGATLSAKANAAGITSLAEKLGIGVPTLQDILRELGKPGRDPRDELPPPLLREDVLDMKDLKEGMTLKGTVRNVIDFGAFVDIGVHQDGLVHVSQISDKFIRHPSEALKVGDVVTVKVISLDLDKKRIGLSMKGI